MKEVWKDIDGYGGDYRVSTTGNVMSTRRTISYTSVSGVTRSYIIGEALLAKTPTKKGYLSSTLTRNSKSKRFPIHRLVAIAFIKNTRNKPAVNHIDSNKKNNNISNLEWCTNAENTIHAMNNGKIKKGEQVSVSKLKNDDVVKIKELLQTKMYHRDIAEIFGVSRVTITNISSKKIWKHI